MRPLEKGSAVCNFLHWNAARDPLADAIGCYCSYCENPLDIPDVEHKANKANAKYKHRALDWDNFLLACGYCNSIKKDKDTEARNVLFPDDCNTAWAFIYGSSGWIDVNTLLTSPIAKQAAEDTRDWLLQLNRVVDTKGNRDLRWTGRLNTWQEARQSLSNLKSCDTPEMRSQIVCTAVGRGYFSVWMTVFFSDPDMLNRFLAAFTGTNRLCFDTNGRVKPTLTP